MTNSFLTLVREMREAQLAYYRLVSTGRHNDRQMALIRAKQAEKQVDAQLASFGMEVRRPQ